MIGIKSDKPKVDVTLGSAGDPNTTIIQRDPNISKVKADSVGVALEQAPDKQLTTVVAGGQPVSPPEAEFKLLSPDFEDTFKLIESLEVAWREIPIRLRKEAQRGWDEEILRIKKSFMKAQSYYMQNSDLLGIDSVRVAARQEAEGVRDNNLITRLVNNFRTALIIPRKDEPVFEPLVVVRKKMDSGASLELDEAIVAIKILFSEVYANDPNLEAVLKSITPDMRDEFEETMQNLDSRLPLISSTTELDAEEYIITREAVTPSLQAYLYLYAKLAGAEDIYRVKNPIQADYTDGSMMLAIPRNLEVLMQVEIGLNIVYDCTPNKKSPSTIKLVAVLGHISDEIKSRRGEASGEGQTDKFIDWIIIMGLLGIIPSVPFFIYYINLKRRANPVPKGLSEARVMGIEQYRVVRTAESIYRLRYTTKNPEANYHTRGYKEAFRDAQVLHEMTQAGSESAMRTLRKVNYFEEGKADSTRVRYDLSEELPRLREMHAKASSRVSGTVPIDVWRETVYRESIGIGGRQETSSLEATSEVSFDRTSQRCDSVADVAARSEAALQETGRILESKQEGIPTRERIAEATRTARRTVEIAEANWRAQHESPINPRSAEWGRLMEEARAELIRSPRAEAAAVRVAEPVPVEVPALEAEAVEVAKPEVAEGRSALEANTDFAFTEAMRARIANVANFVMAPVLLIDAGLRVWKMTYEVNGEEVPEALETAIDVADYATPSIVGTGIATSIWAQGLTNTVTGMAPYGVITLAGYGAVAKMDYDLSEAYEEDILDNFIKKPLYKAVAWIRHAEEATSIFTDNVEPLWREARGVETEDEAKDLLHRIAFHRSEGERMLSLLDYYKSTFINIWVNEDAITDRYFAANERFELPFFKGRLLASAMEICQLQHGGLKTVYGNPTFHQITPPIVDVEDEDRLETVEQYGDRQVANACYERRKEVHEPIREIMVECFGDQYSENLYSDIGSWRKTRLELVKERVGRAGASKRWYEQADRIEASFDRSLSILDQAEEILKERGLHPDHPQDVEEPSEQKPEDQLLCANI